METSINGNCKDKCDNYPECKPCGEMDMEFEFQQAEAFFGGGNKNAGQLVETRSGLIGRTYSHEDLINGKIRVYTESGKLLCDPNTLKLKGFID